MLKIETNLTFSEASELKNGDVFVHKNGDILIVCKDYRSLPDKVLVRLSIGKESVTYKPAVVLGPVDGLYINDVVKLKSGDWFKVNIE
jgi:hypothetical protein